MQQMLETGDMGPGLRKSFIALHHSQVSTDPFNFFVIKRSYVGGKNDEIVIIANPKVLEKIGQTNTIMEGCISFPFRHDKKVLRYKKVKVRYQVPRNGDDELITKEEEIEGLLAQVFQHECQHAAGNHIYK